MLCGGSRNSNDRDVWESFHFLEFSFYKWKTLKYKKNKK